MGWVATEAEVRYWIPLKYKDEFWYKQLQAKDGQAGDPLLEDIINQTVWVYFNAVNNVGVSGEAAWEGAHKFFQEKAYEYLGIVPVVAEQGVGAVFTQQNLPKEASAGGIIGNALDDAGIVDSPDVSLIPSEQGTQAAFAVAATVIVGAASAVNPLLGAGAGLAYNAANQDAAQKQAEAQASAIDPATAQALSQAAQQQIANSLAAAEQIKAAELEAARPKLPEKIAEALGLPKTPFVLAGLLLAIIALALFILWKSLKWISEKLLR